MKKVLIILFLLAGLLALCACSQPGGGASGSAQGTQGAQGEFSMESLIGFADSALAQKLQGDGITDYKIANREVTLDYAAQNDYVVAYTCTVGEDAVEKRYAFYIKFDGAKYSIAKEGEELTLESATGQ